ncbi:MAG: metalloregulator ArsR/SmtB family transcription factor, partial [Gemmatimonadaceae bacterium]
MAPPRSGSDAFVAVADPTRRAILDFLRQGDAPFADIAERFPMSAPAISRHLRVLREARLVRESRAGRDKRQRIYRLAPAPLRDVVEWARVYQSYWEGNVARLKHH